MKRLKLVDKPFLAGTDIEYAHYPYIFDEGPYYGPIGNDIQKIKYSSQATKRQCTVLPTELYEQKYKEEFLALGIGVSKIRSLELDLKSMLDKIFDCFSRTTFIDCPHYMLQYFKRAYQNVFKSEYYCKNELKKRRGFETDSSSKKKDNSGDAFLAQTLKKARERIVAPRARKIKYDLSAASDKQPKVDSFFLKRK